MRIILRYKHIDLSYNLNLSVSKMRKANVNAWLINISYFSSYVNSFDVQKLVEICLFKDIIVKKNLKLSYDVFEKTNLIKKNKENNVETHMVSMDLEKA